LLSKCFHFIDPFGQAIEPVAYVSDEQYGREGFILRSNRMNLVMCFLLFDDFLWLFLSHVEQNLFAVVQSSQIISAGLLQ
jgi:hypothetical protein